MTAKTMNAAVLRTNRLQMTRQRRVIKAPSVRVTTRGHLNDATMVACLLHAYDYCPDDPMICLCLAIASAGRAMQRQSDNRHHLVVQVRVSIIHRRLCTSRFSPVRPWPFFQSIETCVERMLKESMW